MKKLGLILILVLALSIMPISADKKIKELEKTKGYRVSIDEETGYIKLFKEKSTKNIKIKLINENTPSYSELNGKAQHDYRNNIRTETYLVPGGLEYMIILNAPVNTNTFSISVEGEGLEWFYQPPLYEEYNLANETHAWNEEGVILNYRPENIVGSYAIYDGMEKFSHVYRPIVWDSDGDEVWGDMNYDKGVLSITVNQTWLDKAVYPIYIDPTFGYTTIGGTTESLVVTEIHFSWWIYSGLSGTVGNMTAYLNQQEGDEIKLAIYRDNGGGDFDFVGETETWTKTGDGWHTFPMNNTFDVVLFNGTYALTVWTDEPGGTHPGVTWDAGGDSGEDRTVVGGDWPNYPAQIVETVTSTRRYSIYLNYTEIADTAPEVKDAVCPDVNRDAFEFLNVTVHEASGIVSLDFVEVQINTTGDAETFSFRWTQATDLFSLVSDSSNITILNTTGSIRADVNITDVLLSFNFTLTGGTSGLCDVKVFAVDDMALNDTELFNNLFRFVFFTWTDVGFLINSAGEFWGIDDIMGNLATLITGLSGDFSIGITNFLGMIRQQLRLVYQIVGWFITNFTGMVNTVFAVWDGIADLLDGTSILITGVGNWWDFIALDEWIDGLYLGILILWIDSISDRGKTRGEITVFLADVNQLINLSSFFVSISLTVFTLVFNNVLTLFDAIMTVIPI